MRILKANEPHLFLFRRYSLIVILGVVGVSVIFGFVPWLRKPIIREHNFLEMITAICFVLSAALGIYRLQGVPAHFQRRVLAVIPILAIFGFLEEISYGLILAGAHPPQILDVNIDALHDFLLVLYILLRDYVPEWITGILVFIMIILVGYGIRLGRLFGSRTYVLMLRQFPALGFVGMCGVFLIVAAVLDLEIVVSQWLVLAEELLETAASLAMLFAAMAIPYRVSNPNASGG